MTRIGHQRPEPQIELGQSLRELGIHSMNDISDGLSSELNEIAKASQGFDCQLMNRLYRCMKKHIN